MFSHIRLTTIHHGIPVRNSFRLLTIFARNFPPSQISHGSNLYTSKPHALYTGELPHFRTSAYTRHLLESFAKLTNTLLCPRRPSTTVFHKRRQPLGPISSSPKSHGSVFHTIFISRANAAPHFGRFSLPFSSSQQEPTDAF